MRARTILIAAATVVGAAALGVGLCVLKGDGSGLRDWLGNLSAPYLVVAFVAGLTAKRARMGALLGVAATEAAVGGFYWAWAAILGHEVSVGAVLTWGGAGLASGAVLGVLGLIARQRPVLRYALPAVLLLEPLGERLASLSGRWYAVPLDREGIEAFGVEIVVGVLALLITRWTVVRTRASH